MIRSVRRRSSRGAAALLGGGVLLLGELGARAGWWPPTVLPAPSRVLAALRDNASELLRHSATTLMETALGFGLAVLLGLFTAWLLHRLPLLRRAALPWLVVSQTIPLIALAPILLIWLGFGLLPKVLLVTLGCFFPIVVATLDGLERTDPELIRVLQSLDATPRQIDRHLRFPAALPAVFSGLKVAGTYAVTTAIFAEYVGGYAGLGIFIQTSANARATDLVFAAVFLSALFSVLLVQVIAWLARRSLRWLPPENPT